jgi:hypothetical protein
MIRPLLARARLCDHLHSFCSAALSDSGVRKTHYTNRSLLAPNGARETRSAFPCFPKLVDVRGTRTLVAHLRAKSVPRRATFMSVFRECCPTFRQHAVASLPAMCAFCSATQNPADWRNPRSGTSRRFLAGLQLLAEALYI